MKSQTKLELLARKLYESDRAVSNKEIGERNRTLKRDSWFYNPYRLPTWGELLKQHGWLGEPAAVKYRRLAQVALHVVKG
jgi:hypothetical protein